MCSGIQAYRTVDSPVPMDETCILITTDAVDTGETQTPNCARLIEATATDIIETTWLPQWTPSNLESQIQVSMTNTKATAAGALEQTSSTSAGKSKIFFKEKIKKLNGN